MNSVMNEIKKINELEEKLNQLEIRTTALELEIKQEKIKQEQMETELDNCQEDIGRISDRIWEHKIDISQQLQDMQKDTIKKDLDYKTK